MNERQATPDIAGGKPIAARTPAVGAVPDDEDAYAPPPPPGPGALWAPPAEPAPGPTASASADRPASDGTMTSTDVTGDRASSAPTSPAGPSGLAGSTR